MMASRAIGRAIAATEAPTPEGDVENGFGREDLLTPAEGAAATAAAAAVAIVATVDVAGAAASAAAAAHREHIHGQPRRCRHEMKRGF